MDETEREGGSEGKRERGQRETGARGREKGGIECTQKGREEEGQRKGGGGRSKGLKVNEATTYPSCVVCLY